MWSVPESKGITRRTALEEEKLKLVSEGCHPKAVMTHPLFDFMLLTIWIINSFSSSKLLIVYLIWSF